MTGNGNLIPPIFRYDSIPFIHKLLKRMASAEKRLRFPRQPETPAAWPKLSTKNYGKSISLEVDSWEMLGTY